MPLRAVTFDFWSTLVDGTIRIELPRGHEFVREVVDVFSGQ